MKTLFLIVKSPVFIIIMCLALAACQRDKELATPANNVPTVPTPSPTDSLIVLNGTYKGTYCIYGFSPYGSHTDSIINVTGVLKYLSNDSGARLIFNAIDEKGNNQMRYDSSIFLKYSDSNTYQFTLINRDCQYNTMTFDKKTRQVGIVFEDVCGPGGEDYTFRGYKQ